MGIVNTSPDSFSGDGTSTPASACEQAIQQLKQGADIIDIGGESTKPGYEPVYVNTELKRVLPVITALRKQSSCLISVDTQKPLVLRQAHAVGADLLNSIARLTDEMIDTVIDLGVPMVIMHNQDNPTYETNPITVILQYLNDQATRAVSRGVQARNIILDPGLGFGKLPEHNLAILANISRFKSLGFPVLIGPSRKSTIGLVTGKNTDDRTYGTAACVALAIAGGADLVRIHDVAAMTDVARMSDAIVRGWTR